MAKCLSINILAFISFALYWPSLSFSQTTIQPEHLTIKDGLSQGFISALLQDSEGFLWIGTKNGLNRYDGEQFEVFTHDPSDPYSVSHDWVSKLYEAGDFLLVGTTAGGINIFHKRTKRFYKIPPTNPDLKSWATMGIQDIALDALGQIWVLEQSSGLLMRLQLPGDFWQRLPGKEQLLGDIKMMGFPDLHIGAVSKSDSTHIYCFVNSGKLLKINIRSGDWEWFENPLPDKDQMQLKPDIQQGFHAISASINRILLFKDGQWHASHTDFFILDFFYLEDEGQFWINTGQELLMFDQWVPGKKRLGRAEASTVISSPNNSYTTLIRDRSGITWAGTGGYGVVKIAPRLMKIKKYFDGVSIYAPPLMTKAGAIMVGTPQGGSLLKTGPFITSQTIPAAIWWFEDKEGSFWLVGKNDDNVEVHRMDRKGQLQKKAVLDKSVGRNHTATKDPETGTLWVASPNGNLLRYEPPTNEWKEFPFQHLFHSLYDCYSMARTANGHWWIGTSRGLVHAVPKGDSFEFELIQTEQGATNGLLNNDVASLLTDPKDANILWLGTKGGGLHRLDTWSMTFTHLNSNSGLPNDVIYGVLNDDEGNLWMSSNKGIIQYSPTTGVIRNFTEADGMQSDEFNTWAYAKSHTGELMFGGISGLNVFHPDDLKENPVRPKVWITALAVNNQPIAVGDSTGLLEQSIEYTSEISLPFSQNSITLEFAALEFSAALKNRFRYYLEGAEVEWAHEDTDNKASYLSLAPGSYVFKVKASNGDGIWNEQPKELKITILPPWYRSNLALLTYALLFGLEYVLKFNLESLKKWQ